MHGLHSPLFNLYCPPVSTWWLVYFFPKYVSLCMCACVFLDDRVLLLLTWCLHTLFIHFPARDIFLLFFRSLQTSIVTTNPMFSLSIHFFTRKLQLNSYFGYSEQCYNKHEYVDSPVFSIATWFSTRFPCVRFLFLGFLFVCFVRCVCVCVCKNSHYLQSMVLIKYNIYMSLS